MNNNPAIIKRSLREELDPFLKRREYIAIRGPRQAGKTTFVKELEKEIRDAQGPTNFITFEDKGILEIFESDINSFIKLHVLPYKSVFIDEFQYAKGGGQKLKFIHDTTNVKIIITGSSSLELQAKTGKYMVGRLVYFELLPFSFTEYLSAKDENLLALIHDNSVKLKKLLKGEKVIFKDEVTSQTIKSALTSLLYEYVVYGGYPSVVLADNDEVKATLLRNIFQTYISKDIVDLLKLETDSELVKVAQLLALQIGNLIVYDNLSKESGLYYELLKKHLDILSQTYVVELLRPYYTNKRTEIVKNPTPYFLDTGLRNSLINSFSPLLERTDKGSLFENFVFSALKRHTYSTQQVKFWRSKSQAEIDFVLEPVIGEVIPIEVKITAGSSVSIGKSFYSFVEKYKPATAILITPDKFDQRKVGEQTTLYCIPASWL
ncbi:hypothetical protein CO180_00950 [candidate division WWE3 bacterium CG_4_9_14_3_um_filter_41_6]|uniref:AAA+ ATPase domain-containing protein n=1 Tax=candidate division WWE3 bacterium CG_4_10_14_0_2_um_filter_41_14 TaxID=1975072 RepID=A0A2M7TLB6_UNCKA|nr:MAG: hypothetical protein COY32_01030 [candidate division WWE3 bacterium CG_4_10_14_0_2_um_filter_41_14]PJA39374.1 MAG: hypothetical protein CO180_00950 [candidate division WWE3 bacterium CG_4_9_14_3_um_filter_41_6]